MSTDEQLPQIRVLHRAGRLVKEDLLGKMSPTKEKFEESIERQMDEAAANHPEHGLLPGERPNGPLDAVTYQVLDDVFANIVHELLLNTFRDEKIARCNTAAIFLEQKAEKKLDFESSTTSNPLNIEAANAHVKTEFAYFDSDGNTSLIQDENTPFPPIMEAIPKSYCQDCRLPRWPYASEGPGAKKPDDGVEYCKKRVFIDNKPYDIYNQRYALDKKGPGKGNGKKKAKELTPNGSQDSPATSPPSNDQDRPIPAPSVKCPAKDCNRHFPINRVGGHLAREHGKGRRAANTDALEKMRNANGYGSSGSRNATPAPTNGSKARTTSPNKRDLDDFESDESPQKLKKAKTAAPKKLKAPSMTKTSSQLSSSNLNHVETQHSDDDFIDDGDDHRDGDFGTISVDAKKKKKPVPKATKPKPVKDPMKNGDANWPEKKKKAAKTPASSSKSSRPVTPSEPKTKVKLEINGKKKEATGPRGESESSQTLSSPNE